MRECKTILNMFYPLWSSSDNSNYSGIYTHNRNVDWKRLFHIGLNGIQNYVYHLQNDSAQLLLVDMYTMFRQSYCWTINVSTATKASHTSENRVSKNLSKHDQRTQHHFISFGCTSFVVCCTHIFYNISKHCCAYILHMHGTLSLRNKSPSAYSNPYNKHINHSHCNMRYHLS